MRYRVNLSYKGTNYHGWQRQKNVPSVQQTIEEAIAKLIGTESPIIGCGRTDAGVHAKEYIAHFDSEHIIDKAFLFRINKIIPNDISINEVILVGDRFHAQHDAITRTYKYYIHTTPNPFLSDISSLYDYPKVDFELLEKTIREILLIDDFKNFCKRPDQYGHTICKIQAFSFENTGDGTYLITISSNRFLQRMIRLIIGQALQVAKQKMEFSEMMQNLAEQKPFKFQNTAFPQGLFLWKVAYNNV